MIIKECKFEPILIDSRCFRKGVLLQITNQEGKVAQTEISPLPGYSEETLKEALAQLQGLKQRLMTTWWTKQALYYLSNLGLYPSVYFAVESALLDLLDPAPLDLPTKKYALLFGTPEEILMLADEVHEEGLKSAKIKMGHFTPEMAHHIVEEIGDKLKLRIDLNKKWSFKDTMEFLAHYPKDYFEYIEEPTTKPEDLLEFSYPFAMDETLRVVSDLTPYLKCENLKALILKPTMTYPVTPFLNLGKKVILTSSFESPVGIAQIRRLIHRHGLQGHEHGLDTLRYFENIYESLPNSILEKTLS